MLSSILTSSLNLVNCCKDSNSTSIKEQSIFQLIELSSPLVLNQLLEKIKVMTFLWYIIYMLYGFSNMIARILLKECFDNKAKQCTSPMHRFPLKRKLTTKCKCHVVELFVLCSSSKWKLGLVLMVQINFHQNN